MINYKEKYKLLTNVLLNVTDDCNLQCKYCFVEQHPHYMTLETAKKIVDYLYNNLEIKRKLNLATSAEKCSIYFFGGEPMLCYNSIIVPIVQYCNLNYPNCFIFGMTTNGTLLNKENIDFFKQYDFEILLSIDGNKETQDLNRPCRNIQQSSFDLIEKNIAYLLKNFPNITFRSTIYAPTVDKLFENYLYAESLGFKNWVAIADERESIWTDEKLNILSNEFSKIYLYRISQILNNQPVMFVSRINEYLKTTINWLNKNIENDITVDRCGLGTMAASIAYDGSIYGCQEQPSKDKKNIFLIGNIFNGGIDEEKHKKLLNIYIDDYSNNNLFNEQCKICKLKELCSNGYLICPSTSYDLFKNMKYISKINCFTRQIYIKNSLLLLTFLSLSNQENSIKYLKHELGKGGKILNE